jgi:hypothetical protein
MLSQKKLVEQLRKRLKRTKVARRLCAKYGEEPKFIDSIPIRFEPLDVSAKTVDGEIMLNEKLLGGEPRDCLRYLVHELVHCLQQKHGKVDEQSDNVDYLDDPNEKEAFKAQVDFMETAYDPEYVQTYLDGLMSHHDVRGKERLRKIRELKR